MNQDTILQILEEHGPFRDQRETRANVIKKAWEWAQVQKHPDYECTLPAWSFHIKNLEEAGKIVVIRTSPRISTYLELAAPTEKVDGKKLIEEAVEAWANHRDPEESTEVVEVPPTPVPAPVVPTPVRAVTNTDPTVGISMELPAGRAAQILAELSELPPAAVLEANQVSVLIDGYRKMTEQLQTFVSETFAAWLEMTEKLDRIERVLAGSLEPIDTVPFSADEEEAEPTERRNKPVKPKLSAVPRSVSDRDLRVLYGTVAAHGYTVEPSNGGHIKMTPPEGDNGAQVLFGPTTPSDHRSIKNLRAQLRREGLVIP